MFNLTKQEFSVFKKLNTPIKIQDFLDTLPINFEKKGETGMSPRKVLREKIAHCFEGALIAATALWIHGYEPLLLNFKAYPYDDDHTVALYKINGLWGAISKTNHATVRFRDPIFKTTRELALSYFHEYFVNKTGEKVLQSYSKPFNLKKMGTEWITEEKDLWDLAKRIDRSPHIPFYPKSQKKYIRKADTMERKAGKIVEWKE
jgi:hypothetical protein